MVFAIKPKRYVREIMLEFCIWFGGDKYTFRLPKRLYAWRTSGDHEVRIIHYQIDYILQNGVNAIKTYPGPEIDLDHHPVVMDIGICRKKIKNDIWILELYANENTANSTKQDMNLELH